MSHSELFIKACKDTRQAWSVAGIGQKVPEERLTSLKDSLVEASASELADLFMKMAYSPFSSAAHQMGINDGKAMSLSKHLASALLESYVRRREAGAVLDLLAFRAGVANWIDHGELPSGFHSESSDLSKITSLIEGAEARIALTAPIAAPIEFCLVAMDHLDQKSDIAVSEV